eukprot:1686321-Rhodomonas_salina.1
MATWSLPSETTRSLVSVSARSTFYSYLIPSVNEVRVSIGEVLKLSQNWTLKSTTRNVCLFLPAAHPQLDTVMLANLKNDMRNAASPAPPPTHPPLETDHSKDACNAPICSG